MRFEWFYSFLRTQWTDMVWALGWVIGDETGVLVVEVERLAHEHPRWQKPNHVEDDEGPELISVLATNFVDQFLHRGHFKVSGLRGAETVVVQAAALAQQVLLVLARGLAHNINIGLRYSKLANLLIRLYIMGFLFSTIHSTIHFDPASTVKIYTNFSLNRSNIHPNNRALFNCAFI